MAVFTHIFVYFSITGCVLTFQQSSRWKQILALNGYVTYVGSTVTARDVVHCGMQCQSMLGCQSFFITTGQSASNCVLNSQVYSSSVGMTKSPNSRYYEQDSGPISVSIFIPTVEPVSTALTQSGTSTPPLTTPRGTSTPPLTTPRGTSTPPLTTPSGTSTIPLTTPRGTSTPPLTTPRGTSTPPLTTPSGTSTIPLTTPSGTSTPPLTTPSGISTPPLTTPSGTSTPPLTTPSGISTPPLTTPSGTSTPPLTTPSGISTPPLTTPSGTSTIPLTTPSGISTPPLTTPSGISTTPLTTPLPTFQCHANDGVFRTLGLLDGTEFTYSAFQTGGIDYQSAEAFCNSVDSILVHVSSTAKLSMLRDVLSCPGFAVLDYYFVNGMYDESTSEWYFTDDSLATFPNSFWGELFNPGVFSCCVLSIDFTWYLANERCNFIEAFICEK